MAKSERLRFEPRMWPEAGGDESPHEQALSPKDALVGYPLDKRRDRLKPLLPEWSPRVEPREAAQVAQRTGTVHSLLAHRGARWKP